MNIEMGARERTRDGRHIGEVHRVQTWTKKFGRKAPLTKRIRTAGRQRSHIPGHDS
jgi:hypothetical protein